MRKPVSRERLCVRRAYRKLEEIDLKNLKAKDHGSHYSQRDLRILNVGSNLSFSQQCSTPVPSYPYNDQCFEIYEDGERKFLELFHVTLHLMEIRDYHRSQVKVGCLTRWRTFSAIAKTRAHMKNMCWPDKTSALSFLAKEGT